MLYKTVQEKNLNNLLKESFQKKKFQVDAPTPPGTMSLRERMKMFENQNSGRTLPRETVTQAERASDIRSKISSWGQGTSSNQYHVSI